MTMSLVPTVEEGRGESEVETVLRSRALRLARPLPREVAPERQAGAAELAVAEFRLGDERYALPLLQLRAALPLRHVVPVPLAPAHVIGVLRYQGKALAAMSLAALLGIRGWRVDPAVLLVLASGSRMLAVDCEVIPKPAALSLSAVEAARGRERGLTIELPTGDGDIIHLIDLERLFSASRGS